ncbi:MAG TPA: metal-sulfur cluster assembly factor, partial [Vicinamibacteria bacterium]|nr:metal-sulfur cluster assembly factor [Vicinamibacteria bacterium]
MSEADPKEALVPRVRDALREVIDPELGINIVDLGLVYRIEAEAGRLSVAMTMTSPACPLGEHLSAQAEAAVRRAAPEVP